MSNYRVTVLIDASVSVVVRAKNKRDAQEKALNKVIMPSLCHQCAKELNLGDPIPSDDLDLVSETTDEVTEQE